MSLWHGPFWSDSMKDLDALTGSLQVDTDLLEIVMKQVCIVVAKALRADDVGAVLWTFSGSWRRTLTYINAELSKSGERQFKLPFIRLALGEIGFKANELNHKAMDRHGIPIRADNRAASDSTAGLYKDLRAKKVRFSGRIEVVDTDARRMLLLVTRLIDLLATRQLNFKVENYEDIPSFEVVVGSDSPTAAAPTDDQWIDLTTEGAENLMAVSIPIWIDHWLLSYVLKQGYFTATTSTKDYPA